MNRNKKIILAAGLLALLIIQTRFLSLKMPIMRISFAFLPTMLAATYLGWKWTVLIDVLGDLIGAVLFPMGAFFVGYTVSTAITGLIYGIFLYKSPADFHCKAHQSTKKTFLYLAKVVFAVLFVTFAIHAGLNSFWLYLTTGKAFIAIVGMRIVQQLIMIPIQIITFLIVEKVLYRPAQEYLYNEECSDDYRK